MESKLECFGTSSRAPGADLARRAPRFGVLLPLLGCLSLLAACQSAPEEHGEAWFDADAGSQARPRSGVGSDRSPAGEDAAGADGLTQRQKDLLAERESAARDFATIPESLIAPAGADGEEAPRPAVPLDKLSRDVQALLGALKGEDPKAADDAFWKLVEVREDRIPELISQVESTERTRITLLKILVLDLEFKGFMASKIPGMGRMEEFDDEGRLVWQGYSDRLACGELREPAPKGKEGRIKGYKVQMKHWGGFPLGVVVRAGLINRFRSRSYPSGIDHTRDLIGWWKAYHQRVFGKPRRESSRA